MTRAVTTTTTGVVQSVERAGTSRSGNPTYRLTLTDGRQFLTATDSTVGYEATNWAPGRRNAAPAVVLTLNGRGRVVDIDADVTGPVTITADHLRGALGAIDGAVFVTGMGDVVTGSRLHAPGAVLVTAASARDWIDQAGGDVDMAAEALTVEVNRERSEL